MKRSRAQATVQTNAQALPGPDDIQRTVLPNGITLLSRVNANSPSVVLRGYLPAGSLLDPLAQLGLADFTSASLMRGTARRDFQHIYDALESAGASLSFGGGSRTANFGGQALSEDLGLLLELAAEALRQPVFPQEHVERLRAHLLTDLAMRAEDTAEMASLTFEQIVYGSHPFSRPEDGYPETIAAITRQDLVDFHQRHYGPAGMVLAVVGAVQPQAVLELVNRLFGDWQNPQQILPPPLPELQRLAQTRRQNVAIPGKFQADIVMGVAGPARAHPLFLAASLGNNILGQFGMMGRIGEAVREKAGLAYYAYSGLTGGYGPGPWEVAAGVDPQNVEKAIALMVKEIRRFVRQPVRAAELADSQANYIGRLPLSMESNGGVAGSLINLERFELGLDYYRRYPELVKAVTREQILEVAQEHFDPERLGIAVAGP